MEKTSAHWISPSPVSFFCFGGKAKGDYWSCVIIGISIGNNFNFPVKRWGLKKHQEWADNQRAQSGHLNLLFLSNSKETGESQRVT